MNNNNIKHLMNKYLKIDSDILITDPNDKEKYNLFLSYVKSALDTDDISYQEYSDIMYASPLAFKFIGGNRGSEIFAVVIHENDVRNMLYIKVYNIIKNENGITINTNYLNHAGNGLVDRNNKRYSTKNREDAINMLNSLLNTKEMNIYYA